MKIVGLSAYHADAAAAAVVQRGAHGAGEFAHVVGFADAAFRRGQGVAFLGRLGIDLAAAAAAVVHQRRLVLWRNFEAAARGASPPRSPP